MTKSQQQISFLRYGGYYYTALLWDNILQFLGIGKYYSPDWVVGRIYIPNFFLATDWRWKKLYRLIRMTKTSLYFKPIMCVRDNLIADGEKMCGIHRNFRFRDGDANRNPIGEKIIMKNQPQIPDGYSLYKMRVYYYKRLDGETDKQFTNRQKGIIRKKKKHIIKLSKYGGRSISIDNLLKLK
jgi:hypothetical protein